ncbi:MAG TPA: VCBS repeat-containing protein [Acidimicrobiia bacterium]|nr:VCBS repeat-containing protein [Acidimicrobiia bacterium]
MPHVFSTSSRPRRVTVVLAAVATLVSLAVAGSAPAAHASTPSSRAAAVHASSVQLGQVVSPMSEKPYAALPNVVGTNEAFSSPAVGDLNGDSQLEVVTGGMDGWVRVFGLDGSVKWTAFTGSGPIQASPLLYDFNRDGKLDVLVANAGTGDVWVLRGTDGAPLFHKATAFRNGPPGVFGTPAVADLDHDGSLDIIVTSWDNHLYAWHYSTGLDVFPPVWVYDTIWSSPVVADLDGDGWPEIVFGADMDYYPGAPYPGGGLVWVVRHDGTLQPGWPRSLPGQTIWSSPAVVDLNGDGHLDVVVGTGLNFPNAGHVVWGLDRFGHDLPGWPVPTLGAVMASPAVANLPGVGMVSVVAMEGGYITAIKPNGQVLWTQCGASWGCSAGYPTHGGVTIADVDGDGTPDVVSALDHDLKVFNLATGALEASAPLDGHVFAPASTPTVFAGPGETRILVQAQLDANVDGLRDPGDLLQVYEFGTKHTPGTLGWATFKQNMERTGTILDTTPPSVPTLPAASSPATTAANVTWSSSDAGTGVAYFTLTVSDDGGPAGTWYSRATPTSRSGSTASGGSVLYGLPGHTYTVDARAVDGAGNVSGQSSTTVSFAGATRAQPFTAAYTTAWDGTVGAAASAPLPASTFPAPLGRGIAVTSDGTGGYTVDAFGGLHPFGAAPLVHTNAYWPGWDIVRGVALNGDGSGYVLDGFGGLHPFGGAVPMSGAYWRGWDIARGIAMLPGSTKTSPAGYVLDAFGGLHRFGSAHVVSVSGYWPGWAIVRGLALDPDGNGGYTVDGFGGLHPFGGAPAVAVTGYWRGWDIVRGVALMHDSSPGHPQGYTVDGRGALHPFGGAPAVSTTGYWSGDVARGLSIAP